MRRVNLWLVVLLTLIAAPYYWFLIDRSAISIKAKPLDIGQLRGLAANVPGALPTQIRYEIVGTRGVSGNLVTAGAGVMEMNLEILAYQIITPKQPAVTIDAGLRPDLVERFALSHYSKAAQHNVDLAVAQAGKAVTLGGYALHPEASKAEVWRDRGAAKAAAPHAIAPGIVAIPIDGMPAGTQMLFVQTSDGREYLFTGDVAPIPQSWKRTIPPARWIESRDPRVDRAEIVSWLKTIRALKKRTPSLFIVEGSDRMLPAPFAEGFLVPLDNMSQARTR